MFPFSDFNKTIYVQLILSAQRSQEVSIMDVKQEMAQAPDQGASVGAVVSGTSVAIPYLY